MKGLGRQLLAGAGLTAQQDRHGEAGGPPDLADQREQGGALSDQAEALGLVRHDGRQEVKQQRHPPGEEEDDAACEIGGRDLIPRGHPEQIEPAAARWRGEPQGLRSICRGELDRRSAQIRIGERTCRAAAGLSKQRLAARQQDRLAGAQGR